jgi:hypothetical protein
MSHEETSSLNAEHPLLKDLSAHEVLEAAERWVAMTTQFQFPLMAPQGFTDAEQAKNPNRRSLSLTMELNAVSVINEHPSVTATRQEAAYKLTEMADLARARVLEERSA